MSGPRPTRVAGFGELQRWLEPRLGAVRCVSFDIFDTLLARCIEPPDDLQHRVAALLAARLGGGLGADAALAARRAVEAELRREALSDGKDHECHFDPLVDRWVERLAGHADAQLVDFVHDTERQLEACALAAKPGAAEMLAWLRARGLRTIAVSDMYLSHDHVAALLGECGLAALLDRIYVSSEFGLGKYSGRLHGKVLELEGLAAEQVVHVGDNLISDMVAPVRLGLRGVYLDERAERLRRRRQTLSAEMAGRGGVWPGRRFFEIVDQRLGQPGAAGHDEFFFRYGLQVLGPAFGAFTQGLVERLRRDKPDRIFFLARDGYLLQQAYERWRQLEGAGAGLPEPVYAYASRRVVASASVAEGLSHAQAVVAFYNPKQQGLLSVLKTYGLAPDDFRDLAGEHGFPVLEEPLQDWQDPRLLAFLADERVQGRIIPQGRQARQLLHRYFEQQGFFAARRAALVDIGWNGTIQKFLHDTFASRPDYPDVHGYYFAFVAAMHGDCGLGERIEGLLFDARRNDSFERSPLDFEEIFEQGARSPEGTTLGYREEAGRVVPVLKSDEAPDRAAEQACNPLIAACQAGVLAHLEHFHAAARLTGYGFDQIKPYVLGLLERAVAYPTAEEVANIGRLVHTEDFGHDHTLDIAAQRVGYLDLLRPRRLAARLRHEPWKFAPFAAFASRLPAWLFRLSYLRIHGARRP